jgi:hypothetical protein
MRPWQLYIMYGDDDKAHSYSFAPTRTFGDVVIELFEKLDIPNGETPLDYGLYITEATYSRSKKSDASESVSRSRAGSLSETGGAPSGDSAVDAVARSWVDDDKRLIDLQQLSKQRTILLLAKRPQPLRVTLLDANEPTTFFFDETDTILQLKTRFLSRVLSSMAADALATASREVDDYGLFVDVATAAASVAGGGAGGGGGVRRVVVDWRRYASSACSGDARRAKQVGGGGSAVCDDEPRRQRRREQRWCWRWRGGCRATTIARSTRCRLAT